METHDLLHEMQVLINQAEFVKSVMITQNNHEQDEMTALIYEMYWMFNRLTEYV